MPAQPSDPASLGRAVRELRMSRGLTQEDLADASGLHPTYVSGIECGRRNPTWVVVGRLAVSLGVSVSELARRSER